ncbi:MAG: LLM class flavin-dependent oxidoreductase [Streptosporangiales bacterium]|nr:LLM class flavin-dependent oxidoreductase [Streptosporangiales bacterium]
MTVQFGLAIENFTPARKDPDIAAIVEYATTAEALGFDSLWAWDHLLLGAGRPFPFLESLSTLTAIAAHTSRVLLGTGVLVLPLRNPVVLAKVTGTLDTISGGRLVLGAASGWYEREFEAAGIPFRKRGKIFERNLEVLTRLWEEESVTGTYDDMDLRRVRMLPLPPSRPRPRLLIGGYVDKVLRRVATKGDGWLTYFYRPDSFQRSWTKIQNFAEEAGRDPAALTNVAQLPICVGDSYDECDRLARDFVAEYFDCPEWSESTPDSAIRGTPAECAEQLAEHIAAGAQHICLVPHEYRPEQVRLIAEEVLPLLRGMGDQVETIVTEEHTRA